MSTMTRETLPVNRDRTDVEADPRSWPSWTDERWTIGPDPDPSPEDAAWAAQVFNGDDEDVDERAALEAAATDSLERGLIPRDLAETLARTSLVGLTVDAIVHRGSDPEWCSCEPCVWERTRRYAE